MQLTLQIYHASPSLSRRDYRQCDTERAATVRYSAEDDYSQQTLVHGMQSDNINF